MLPSKAINYKIICEVKGPETSKNPPFLTTPLGKLEIALLCSVLGGSHEKKKGIWYLLIEEKKSALGFEIGRN